MPKPIKPAASLLSYAGRVLGPYTWFAFDAATGYHYLKTASPESWIRLKDAQWSRDDALFGAQHHWFDVPNGIAVRKFNRRVPRTVRLLRRRKHFGITSAKPM